MRGDVLEIGESVRRSRYPISVISDDQKLIAVLTATSNDDCFGVRIDAVLNELRDGLQRVTLGKRNDTDGVPIVAYAQFASFGYVRFRCATLHHGGCRLSPVRRTTLMRHSI